MATMKAIRDMLRTGVVIPEFVRDLTSDEWDDELRAMAGPDPEALAMPTPGKPKPKLSGAVMPPSRPSHRFSLSSDGKDAVLEGKHRFSGHTVSSMAGTTDGARFLDWVRSTKGCPLDLAEVIDFHRMPLMSFSLEELEPKPLAYDAEAYDAELPVEITDDGDVPF